MQQETTSPTSLHDLVGTLAGSEYNVSSSDDSASEWNERRSAVQEWLDKQYEPGLARPLHRLTIRSFLKAAIFVLKPHYTVPCAALLLYFILRQ